jgi:hypothetical protein
MSKMELKQVAFMPWHKTKLLLVIVVISALIALMTIQLSAEAETTSSSVNDLAKWRQAELLSTTFSHGAFSPHIQTAPNGSMMAVYNHRMDSITTRTNPYYRFMPANDNNWSAPQLVQDSAISLLQVSFAFNSNSIAHAVWRTNQAVFHAHQGQWPNESNLVVSRGRAISDPAIDIGGDSVIHIVWREADEDQNQQDNVYHTFSTNNGSSWSAPTPLATNTRTSSLPTVAIDSQGNAHVGWVESIFSGGNFNYQIRYKKGAKVGGSYQWDNDPFIASGTLNTAWQPTLETQGETLHLSFTNRVSDNEQYAYYRRMLSNGSWEAIVDVTQNNPLSVNTNTPFVLGSSIAICDDSLALFYHGNPVAGDREQIFGHMHKNSWSGRDTVTTGQNRTVRPSITCRNNVIHVVYEQILIANQNHQIYYMFARNVVFLPTILKNSLLFR